jgi:hypothetical protein
MNANFGSRSSLQKNLVVFNVNRKNRSENAGRRHDIRALDNLGHESFAIRFLLARITNHEHNHERQNGDHHEGKRIHGQ